MNSLKTSPPSSATMPDDSFPGWHLAQFNYAKAKFDPSDARMGDFVNALEAINNLADRSPGFVWRLKTEAGHSIDVRPWPNDPLRLVTLSAWDSIGALARYAYAGEHARFMARRHEWFERPQGTYLVLWWVSEGHIPSVEEGVARLEHLQEHGPSPHAFSFTTAFDPKGNSLRNLNCPHAHSPKGPAGEEKAVRA